MAAPLLANDSLQATNLPTLIGILAESPSEKRVSMVPDVAAQLVKDGYTVNVEKGAGVKSSFSDAAYSNVGCKILSHDEVLKQSNVFFRIDAPVADFPAMSGKVAISWVGRLQDAGKKIIEQACTANVTLLDVTAVPRITIAQKLDVLSSQAKCAGHRAVLEAAHAFGRFHTSEMTAAGKFPPSHTFILGCGVAGLAAIGTSRAMGSIVRAWDVRDVHDQVESMGGKWVKVDFKEDASAAGGYAKESSQEFMKAQRETFHRHAKEVDIIITTAAIPGRPSPTLITDDMVKDMKAGSVIVDLAALGGGNCTMTKKDEIYTTENGVTIIGYCDLPGRLAPQASAMYATNMLQLLRHVHGKDGASAFTSNLFKQLEAGEDGDLVSRSIVTCKDKKPLIMPKPPMIGAPAAKKEAPAPVKEKKKENPQKDATILALLVTAGIAVILLSSAVDVTLVRSFLLAGAAGYQAVWGVAHALHTPLMSVTNAISGLTAIGGIMLMDRMNEMAPDATAGRVLAVLSAMVSAVNIIGGFVVSQRMLNLFKRPGDVDFSYYMIVPGLVLMLWPWLQDMPKPLEQSHSELDNTVSALLCITSIVALSSMKSANLGCKFGMMGAAGAVAVALRQVAFSEHAQANMTWVMAVPILMAFGGLLGLYVGGTVSPIALPQTVAAFHSLVGLAAMLTSIGSFYEKQESGMSLVNITAMLGNFIGGITLTGSIVAFGKLNGNLSSKALNLPFKNWINMGLLTTFIVLFVCFVQSGGATLGEAIPIVSGVRVGVVLLWAAAVIAGIMGWHLVGSVGGGDMPVCVTVLNSYSGWALAAEGFNLSIPLLAVVGSIIGFSGAILTKIMCDAMNRDIFNVIFGGMNAAPPAKKGEVEKKVHVETTVSATAELIASAKEVVVVPGYGMAVARAQNAIGEVAKLCREKGINCRFAIHPVAGRMPGQMNVLLAEAGVPYDWVQEMDEVNPDMEKVDVVLVMGANDITNSAAQEVEGCPIYGMPVIEVWRAKKTVFCKRSMGGGYADLENPVFFKENTMMLLGDAKKTASELSAALKTALDASV